VDARRKSPIGVTGCRGRPVFAAPRCEARSSDMNASRSLDPPFSMYSARQLSSSFTGMYRRPHAPIVTNTGSSAMPFSLVSIPAGASRRKGTHLPRRIR